MVCAAHFPFGLPVKTPRMKDACSTVTFKFGHPLEGGGGWDPQARLVPAVSRCLRPVSALVGVRVLPFRETVHNLPLHPRLPFPVTSTQVSVTLKCQCLNPPTAFFIKPATSSSTASQHHSRRSRTSSQLSAVCNAALVDWAVTREGLLALDCPHNIKAINNLHQQQRNQCSSQWCPLIIDPLLGVYVCSWVNVKSTNFQHRTYCTSSAAVLTEKQCALQTAGALHPFTHLPILHFKGQVANPN